MQEYSVVIYTRQLIGEQSDFLLLLETAFRNHKHPVGKCWRMEETYIGASRKTPERLA